MTSLSNKTFFYERYQKNSFRFGFSAHKMYNKIFISKFFEAINFSASVVWRPELLRPPVFLFFELEQFRDQFWNPWKILHNPSYPQIWISNFFSKGPTLIGYRMITFAPKIIWTIKSHTLLLFSKKYLSRNYEMNIKSCFLSVCILISHKWWNSKWKQTRLMVLWLFTALRCSLLVYYYTFSAILLHTLDW